MTDGERVVRLRALLVRFADELAGAGFVPLGKELRERGEIVAALCEWCRGRGVYAHEVIETGCRNAINCPRCKGSGKEPTA